MSRLGNFLTTLLERIRDSESFQHIKTKYDELDSQAKVYLNLGVLGSVIVVVLISVFGGIAKVNIQKGELNEREELIGFLQRSADSIKQLKSQQQQSRGAAEATTLVSFVETILTDAAIDRSKVELGTETPGGEDKESKESLLDVKFSQINLRQLTRFCFKATEQGSSRALNIRDITVDTKEDPSGYIDATVTLAGYKAK